MHRTIAILIARVIFGGVFVMAASFKFAGMPATAGYIAAAGFPFGFALAWVAALFECGLAMALLTGAFFREAALVAAAMCCSWLLPFTDLRTGTAIRRNSDFSWIISPSSPGCCSRPFMARVRRWCSKGKGPAGARDCGPSKACVSMRFPAGERPARCDTNLPR